MSGIGNFLNEFWWILPLALFGLCIFTCFLRRGREGADCCMCGGFGRDKQNNRPN